MNKVVASNIFLNSSLQYYFWTEKFNLEFIRSLDREIRSVMNTLGAKHTNIMNEIIYLPRSKGGRGLISIERLYKESKIKTAVKVAQDPDKRMQIVKQFHLKARDTTSYSLFKEARSYADEFGFILDINANNVSCMFYDTDGVRKNTDDSKIIFNEMKSNRCNVNISKILASNWQGVIYASRSQDETVCLSHFDWLQNWKMCPTHVISEFFLLFYQLLPTKCYKAIRGEEIVPDTLCRLCKNAEESVRHLMSNCSPLAKHMYKRRHDDVLKCFIFYVMNKYQIIEKYHPWWTKVEVKPYYENEMIKLWWDIPEYSGRDEEDIHGVPRPDAKIELINEKKIFLVEQSIPWITNRENKYVEKEEKYIPIQNNLRMERSDYTIGQITLVMDSFGGYSKNLIDNIAKITENKSDISQIISNMQKSVISNASHLSKTFKAKVM